MPSKLKTYTILITYCISLAIIATLFIIVKEDSNPYVKNYSSVFILLFTSVFLLMVSCLGDLRSKEKNVKYKKILNMMSIILSCIGLFVSIINMFNLKK